MPSVSLEAIVQVEGQPQRRAGLGDDFLSKLDDNLAPRGAAKAAAPTFNASAKATPSWLPMPPSMAAKAVARSGTAAPKSSRVLTMALISKAGNRMK